MESQSPKLTITVAGKLSSGKTVAAKEIATRLKSLGFEVALYNGTSIEIPKESTFEALGLAGEGLVEVHTKEG